MKIQVPFAFLLITALCRMNQAVMLRAHGRHGEGTLGMNPLLNQMQERLEAVERAYSSGSMAGDDYTQALEEIREDLDSNDASGTSLGTMVGQQLLMTEVETELNKMKYSKDGATEVKKQEK